MTSEQKSERNEEESQVNIEGKAHAKERVRGMDL
jgi:hypothetical protein